MATIFAVLCVFLAVVCLILFLAVVSGWNEITRLEERVQGRIDRNLELMESEGRQAALIEKVQAENSELKKKLQSSVRVLT